MITVADLEDIGFLTNYDESRDNVGVAIDEHVNPAEVHEAFQKSGQRKTAYANGITRLLHKPGLFFSISEAKYYQARGDSFKMIFTWVLSKESAMHSFLGLHLDAILVDLEGVEPLVRILQKPEFAAKYELAMAGHNPWTAPPLPSYSLTIKTRDRQMAGTDSAISFRLKGSTAVLDGRIDTNFTRIMEKNGINHVVLQGEDVGIIESLSIELLDDGLAASWLPESIVLESALHDTLLFSFGEDEWIKRHAVVTKNATKRNER
jgi:hypothetical protein